MYFSLIFTLFFIIFELFYDFNNEITIFKMIFN